MYGCETWKVNKGDEKKIDVFQNNTNSQYEMAGTKKYQYDYRT